MPIQILIILLISLLHSCVSLVIFIRFTGRSCSFFCASLLWCCMVYCTLNSAHRIQHNWIVMYKHTHTIQQQQTYTVRDSHLPLLFWRRSLSHSTVQLSSDWLEEKNLNICFEPSAKRLLLLFWYAWKSAVNIAFF